MKILVLVANGLHIGYLGCYGNEWIETPNLDRLAAEGVVFDQHLAASPELARACRAWLTGRFCLPRPGDVDSGSRADEFTLFGEECAPGGIQGSVLGFEDDCTQSDLHRSNLHVRISNALEESAADAHALLRCEMDLHPPWQAPQDLLDHYMQAVEDQDDEGIGTDQDGPFLAQQAQYAAAVTQFDRWLGQVTGRLGERGLLERICIIVTAHCGQSLGEHVTLFPTWSRLHEEMIHVPLIVRLPERAEAGRRVPALTQSIDFLPTLCDLFAVPAAPVHGHSLVPLLHGKASRIREYACAGYHQGDTLAWSLRTAEWSFHLPVQTPTAGTARQPLLYVKPDDRWEVNNLYQHYLDWAERLEETLRIFAKATRREGPFQPPPLPDFITREEQQAGEKPSNSSEAKE